MQDLMERHWHHLPQTKWRIFSMPTPSAVSTGSRPKSGSAASALMRSRRARAAAPCCASCDQFNQALVYVLLAAILVKLALGAYVDAGVIFGVVLLNAVIGFVQESKAASALDALSRALITEATVVRAGERRRIDARELVPGDLVLLASGDKVPADLRLLQGTGSASATSGADGRVGAGRQAFRGAGATTHPGRSGQHGLLVHPRHLTARRRAGHRHRRQHGDRAHLRAHRHGRTCWRHR